MARQSRDARLETREARTRLKVAKEPHWRQIHPGLFVGYYKGRTGGVWFSRRLVGGRYAKTRLGTADDFQDANGIDVLSYAQAHRLTLDRANATVKRDAGQSYTVADAMADYLAWFKAHRKAYRQTELAIEAHINPALGNKRVAELETTEIRKWHQDLALAPLRRRGKRVAVDTSDAAVMRRRRASANRILTILRAGLNFAYHEGRAPSADPWERVKPFRGVDEARIHYLSESECTRLINACEPDFRHVVQAALYTGCRYGEITRLQCADYNADVGTVTVRETKSDKVRHVPLTDEGRRFFDRATAGRAGDRIIFLRHDGLPWGTSHQARPLRDACRIANISPAASFHILRHAYGSLLAKKGVPLHVISAALGHADVRMTQKYYAHLQPNYVADTIRAHLPSFSGEPDNVRPMRKKTP